MAVKQIGFYHLASIFDAKIQIPDKLIFATEQHMPLLTGLNIVHTRLVVLVVQGSLTMSINRKEQVYDANTFIDITNEKVVQFIAITPATRFYCLFTTIDSLREMLKRNHPVPREYIIKLTYQPAMSLLPDDTRALDEQLRAIGMHIARKEHLFYYEIAAGLFTIFMFEIGNIFARIKNTQKKEFTLRKQDITTFKFIDLVRRHCREQHEIEFYARQLYITPKHLGRVVKEVTGKTLSEIISNELILEAVDLLARDEMQIQQIADALHFADIASFSKFFKRHTGLSPLQYRTR